MKKGINKSILFYVVSALFLIASAIGLTTGNVQDMHGHKKPVRK